MNVFSTGDDVLFDGKAVKLVAGPFRNDDGQYFVSEDGAGVNDTPHIRQLQPIPPADPRVDVVARALQQQTESAFRRWESVSESGKASYRDDAVAILAALDAAQPAAPARYKDADGDTWEEQPDGSYLHVRGHWSGDDFKAPHYIRDSLDDLGRVYGPLTRIN